MTTPSHTITFGYRTAAVVIHDDKVLLHRAETDSFWSLPGGKVEFLEASHEALKREITEEAGTPDLQILRLLWIVENFFIDQGNSFHELEFYYLCRLPSTSPLLTAEEFAGMEEHRPGHPKLSFRWFSRTEEALKRIPILPIFLQTALTHLPERTSHIISKTF